MRQVINNSDKFFSQVNLIELLIVITCAIVLIMTTLIKGQPSETIIGILGGYLGSSAKSHLAKNNTISDMKSEPVEPKPTQFTPDSESKPIEKRSHW